MVHLTIIAKTAALSKVVATDWSSLSAEERKRWEEEAQSDRERYDREIRVFQQCIDERSDNPDLAKPPVKKPMSAFFEFARTRRNHLRHEHKEKTNAEVSKMLSVEWHALPPEEKKPFTDLFDSKMEIYKQQMEPFRSKKKRGRKQYEAPPPDEPASIAASSLYAPILPAPRISDTPREMAESSRPIPLAENAQNLNFRPPVLLSSSPIPDPSSSLLPPVDSMQALQSLHSFQPTLQTRDAQQLLLQQILDTPTAHLSPDQLVHMSTTYTHVTRLAAALQQALSSSSSPLPAPSLSLVPQQPSPSVLEVVAQQLGTAIPGGLGYVGTAPMPSPISVNLLSNGSGPDQESTSEDDSDEE